MKKLAFAALGVTLAMIVGSHATAAPVAPSTPKVTPSPAAPPAVPKYVHFEAGTNEWTQVSGYGGTGVTRTGGPKDGSLDVALHSLTMSETFDDPNYALLDGKRLDDVQADSGTWNRDLTLPAKDNYTNNRDNRVITFTARRFIRGVQVCTGNEKDTDDRKIKGVRLYYATVKTDGTVDNDDTSGTAWERTNCKDWQAARYCPSAKVTRSMKFLANSKNKWFQGIQLECMKPSLY